jgi:hypothetical protein
MVALAIPLSTAATNTAPVDLGTAAPFVALGGAGITFAGSPNSTILNGDIGTYPTTAITGLGNVILNGVNHGGDAITQTGKVDLVTAYNDAAGRPADVTYGAVADLGGLTLTPGVYSDPTSFAITGTLTLDAQGNTDAVWIFQAGSTLITASASLVSLTNGAQARNVFWQVGSSATLGTYSVFRGTLLALTDITMTTGAMIEGRALARNGAITFDQQIGILPVSAPCAIGNRVWLDENANGIQDAGEAGIANVRVILLTTNSVALSTNVTGIDGGYLFGGLEPGDYTLRVDTSSMASALAVNPTCDPDATTDNQTTVALPAGLKIMTADFGYNWAPTANVVDNTGTGAIGDRIWMDANGDGVQNPGEPGLGGVMVTLVNLGPDGITGTADDTTNTTTTAADGTYSFTGLAAGACQVTVNNGSTPAGTTPTGDPDGVFDNMTTTPIMLAPGDVYVNADFGYQPSSGSTIGSMVYFDANADGTTNGNDYGLAGVTVSLLNSNWQVVATTGTGTNGQYRFTGVQAGTFTVWVSDTYGVLTLMQQSGDPDGPGSLDSGSTLAVNGTNSTLDRDFGYTAIGQTTTTALIGDTVYLDRNGNGSPDPGEGLGGVTVSLTATNGFVLKPTVTDPNGDFTFGGLLAGTYAVVVAQNTLPGTSGQLTNTQDPDGGTPSQATVTLTAGQINLTTDFG